MTLDRDLRLLLGGVLVLLAGRLGGGGDPAPPRDASEAGRATVANLAARINAWWVMVAVFAAALVLGPTGSVVLFAHPLVPRAARVRHPHADRPRRPCDAVLELLRRAAAPVRAGRLPAGTACSRSSIPVYAFLFVPTRSALAGDTARLPRARGEDPVGADDRGLLPEPRPGAAHAAGPRRRGRRRQAAALPGAGRPALRRLPVRLGQTARPPQDRARASAPTRRSRASSAASPPRPRSAPASGGRRRSRPSRPPASPSPSACSASPAAWSPRRSSATAASRTSAPSSPATAASSTASTPSASPRRSSSTWSDSPSATDRSSRSEAPDSRPAGCPPACDSR